MMECNNLKLKLGHSFMLQIEFLHIKNKSYTHLAGKNGSGKSSLLKTMLDLYPRQSGVIRISGKDVSKDESWKLFTGVFLGSSYLPGFLTALEYFDLMAKIRNLSFSSPDNYVNQYFSDLCTPEILDNKTYIRDLSSGNQVRVGIIAAMISSPALLVLDEPFAYLDQSAQVSLKQHLKSHFEKGTTILITCHDPLLLDGLTTDTILLENGIMIN
jgi:ABC-2 type transport system ATP-binding protein